MLGDVHFKVWDDADRLGAKLSIQHVNLVVLFIEMPISSIFLVRVHHGELRSDAVSRLPSLLATPFSIVSMFRHRAEIAQGDLRELRHEYRHS